MIEHLLDKEGLHTKFIIERTDGRSRQGEKHDGCRYFVLDLDHDIHAVAALDAYRLSCIKEKPTLANDLEEKLEFLRSQWCMDVPTIEKNGTDD